MATQVNNKNEIEINISTSDMKNWEGIPYYPINQYYKKMFGEKVYKISVSMPGSCPNRDGIKGMKPCVFCDEWGSAAFPEYRESELLEQINKIKDVVRIRNKVNKFLLYFQAYTNTFRKVSTLKQYFDVVKDNEEICGYVVGTRPDCISKSVIELYNEYQPKKPIFVELGVQSFDNDYLKWMERGHTAEKSEWAIKYLRENSPDVNIGVHLIFGLPNETNEHIKIAADKVNQLGVDNVKLHNLHVLKKTPLEQMFNSGEFTPLSQEAYAERVALFLSLLNPEIAVQRLTAVASRHDELVAPRWTSGKMSSYQYMLDYLKEKQIYQGQNL